MSIDDSYVRLGAEELAAERAQAIDEGRQFGAVESAFDRVQAAPDDRQDEAVELLEEIQSLPLRDDFDFVEPSDLAGIKEERPDGPRTVPIDLDDAALRDRFHGAWLGRCSGCLLGKPVEGWPLEKIRGYLEDIGEYPLRDYFRSDVPEEVWERYDLDEVPDYHDAFINHVDHMARDDDIDYTITGLALIEEHGMDFTSEDVASFWLSNLPAFNTFTAERIAYRNFLNTITPPESARHCNPYREGIGAQIRGDFYGYVSLGEPEHAAELAWRDARISHVKNGIYGEMWVAAMLAAAPAMANRIEVIRAGLSEVPADSRLAAAVEDVIEWYEGGVAYDEAVERVHERWDEDGIYGWLHTISNAQIVAIGLLWGEGDFERSICRAVQAAFDTDCNGATVGSVIGMMQGADALPEKWTSPLNDTVETALVEYPRERISDLADRTFELYAAA